VAERLREVAQELSADRIDLLGKQADVVDEGGRSFEDGAGPGGLSGAGQSLGQPEGAEKKLVLGLLPGLGSVRRVKTIG
jgi:hypothetical protein